MIEIVFSNSARGSLMQGKSMESAQNRKDIYAFELALSVGDISEDIPGPRRQAVLEDLLTVAILEEKPRAAQNVADAWETLHHIQVRYSQGEDLRIWYSDNPDDRCGLTWLLSHLDGQGGGKVWLVKLPDWRAREDGVLVQYRGWGEVEPEVWMDLVDGQDEAPSVLFRACRQEWKALQKENAPLRAVVNGCLMGVPETFYDHILQWALDRQSEEFSIGHLLGMALSRQTGVGDGWFALRAEEWIRAGVLVVTKEAPKGEIRYRRILRKA